MSSAPSEMTCGTPCSPAAVSRSGPRRQDAADQLVGQLRRGEVEHAGDQAVGMNDSIVMPPVPVAWKTSTS